MPVIKDCSITSESPHRTTRYNLQSAVIIIGKDYEQKKIYAVCNKSI